MLDFAASWRDRLVGNPAFRAWAARFPLTRLIARRRARQLFDVCAGFVYAQVLLACVQLDWFERLRHGPLPAEALSGPGLTAEATERLLRAAAALDLLERRGTRWGLGSLGAAMVDNPAVASMVRHHGALYADLADPVSLLRAGQGRLADYWGYARAAQPGSLPADQVSAYSELMAASQPLVAAEILDAYDVRRHRVLMDVAGGDGRFLVAAAARAPALRLMLFDLPSVVARAESRLATAGLAARTQVVGGDMFRDSMPQGADLVTLVRVVHDHDDPAAQALLRAVRSALPPGGVLLLAEPMAGTRGAEPVGDTYFGMYLLAMGSGRARTATELTDMLHKAGFARVRQARTATPLQTGLLVATVA